MKQRLNQALIYILTLLMIFSSLAIPAQVYAAPSAPVKVEEITLVKVYTTLENPDTYNMTIRGDANTNFSGVVISYEDPAGKLITLTNPAYSSPNIVQYTIDPNKIGSKLYIAGNPYDISETDMAKLTAINPQSVKKGQDLKVSGINFDKLSQDQYESYYYDQITKVNIDNKLTQNDPKSNTLNIDKTGVYNMRFERNFTTLDSVKINISYRYLNIFRVYDDLENISTEISMFPNRGEKGSLVYFKADDLRGDISVFFLTKDDGTDQFTQLNKAKNITYKKDAEGTLDIVTCTVPTGITSGKEYFIYFTNYVPDTGDPMKLIYKQIKLPSQFTVIDVGDKVTIQDIDPRRGPDTGQSIEIVGKYLGSLNIDGLLPTAPLTDPGKITINNDRLSLIYGDGKYNDKDVTDITKTVEVYIGAYASFEEKSQAISNFHADKDRIYVKTPTMSLDKELTEDVVVNTYTTFKIGTVEYKFEETSRFRGFTFQPSSTKPAINKVIPGKVQIEKKGTEYIVKSPTVMAIYGKDFKIYRETTADGVVIRYPLIRITDNDNQQITIDATKKQVLNYQDTVFKDGEKAIEPQVMVFDSNGQILDGSNGKDTGTKILFTLPAGVKVTEPQPHEAAPRDVEVINPIKNSAVLGLKATAADVIDFVITDKTPIIQNIHPDTVPITGGEEVTINGSNFLNGVKVFIDGSEVTGIIRDGMGQTIKFKAPPGREGTTQLQVMNEGGGTAIWPFRYVKTYTNPKITDFNPKAGNTGALIVIKGENFMLPNPASGNIDIMNLIGTRVYLGDKDINSYNRNSQNQIVLKDYTNDNNQLLKIYNTNLLKCADYYNSIVLTDASLGTKKYYLLQQALDGTLRLTDGVSNVYVLSVKDNAIQALKENGDSYTITVNKDGLTLLKGTAIITKLTMQTPYAVTDDKITGHRIQVMDSKEIHCTVPVLPASGYYDLTVINPDTKQDSRLGNLGFYYYAQPQSKPEIKGISPTEGSTTGGYPARITGADFKDSGQSKSRVFINGIEINPADTTIGLNGNYIDIIVPAYPGDLFKEKGVNSIKVPVIVTNPDGATVSREDCFTYIVPNSAPKITKIIPTQGAAAGGNVVEIIGEDFRFFEPFDDKNRNGLLDNDENYVDCNQNSRWDDFRKVSQVQEAYEKDKKTATDYNTWFKEVVTPVLPKVYFDSKQVDVTEFSDGYLKVISPAGSAGKVDLFVVNNDTGTSNKITYTYDASNPKISNIIPNVGKKQGRDKIEIFGSNFSASTIKVYDTLENITTITQPLVRFGNISNVMLQREHPNGGRIDNQRSTVEFKDSGMTISYDGTTFIKELTVKLHENDKDYMGVFKNYNDETIYLNLGLLKTAAGSSYPGYELVKVSVTDRRLLVERGYSPQVNLNSSTQLAVTTSSYYTIGEVEITVVNPDNSTAQGKFTYKNPDSHPEIINITQNGNSPELMDIDSNGTKTKAKILRINYKGQAAISVIGKDFRDNATIHIGNSIVIPANNIQYQLPDKLSFTMPTVPESLVGKLQPVLVQNEDGASVSSAALNPPIYIQFTKGETDLEVIKVTPNIGPATGSTVVLLEGKGFRDKVEGFSGFLSVYFGNRQATNVERLDNAGKTLRVVSPGGMPGKQAIRVENPDGSISAPAGEFTYISNPQILAVVDPADPTENRRLRSISIDGEQLIKIKGSGFMPGAKVIFAPETEVIENSTNNPATGTNHIYWVGQETVSGHSSSVIKTYNLTAGTEGKNTNYIDSETLTVTVPAGKLDTQGIMVINPDKGASQLYPDITYELPELTAPTNVVAEIVWDDYDDYSARFIKISWQPVTGATQYDVYVSIDGDTTEFIGSTALTSFLYKDLQPRTRYRFIIKSIGTLGSSLPSLMSNEVKTRAQVGPADIDGRLDEKTQQNRSGNTALVSLGTRDYAEQTRIDLTKGSLAGCKELVLTLPAQVVGSSYARDIQVQGSDFSLRINPNAFNIGVLQQRNNQNSGVQFRISPENGAAITGSGNSLSTIYKLEASAFVDNNATSIDFLVRDIYIAIDENNFKTAFRRSQNPALYRYDITNRRWDTTYNWSNTSTRGLVPINRLGYYNIMGTRR